MSTVAKGCGCVFFAMLRMCGCPFAGGAMMGDYGGPPEGAATDAQTKGNTLHMAFVWFVICAVTGSWLVVSRRRR